MRLEPELWDALSEICRRERVRMGELVRRVEARGHAGGRTSAVRVFILEYYRQGGAMPAELLAADVPYAA